MGHPWVAAGAALAFLSVALGAFGAHALRSMVPVELLATWRTGVEYQMFHSLGLLVVGSIELPARVRTAVGALFCVGIALFSGSLYLLVLTGMRGLGAVTPIGGVVFLVGWAVLAAGALKR